MYESLRSQDMNIGLLKYADELGTGVQKNERKKKEKKRKRSKGGLHKERGTRKASWQVSRAEGPVFGSQLLGFACMVQRFKYLKNRCRDILGRGGGE